MKQTSPHTIPSAFAAPDHPPPLLEVRRIGIISRDYRRTFPNGRRDFSHVLGEVLRRMDAEGCDSVLFSLFSIDTRADFSTYADLTSLSSVKAVFLEEFTDGPERRRYDRFVTYYRAGDTWNEYGVLQQFATSSELNPTVMSEFVRRELPKRVMGNCCVVLCGETNGVKYSRTLGQVEDVYGLRAALPEAVRIILNPIHDRMTRYEMKLKRQYLSERGRHVVSVWNRGKTGPNGTTRDGTSPPWTIFHDGRERVVAPSPNSWGLDTAIVDTGHNEHST